MSSTRVCNEETYNHNVQTLYKNVLSSSSSEEPPMEQWSSLEEIVLADTPKMILFKAGLYDPGSGNICTKYIQLSDSEVLRHPYYNYRGVRDPGIMEALLGPEDQKVYARDGQELYLDLCKEMDVIPVGKFHRGMLKDTIDLRYYGVNPKGVRAMCLALTYNHHVSRLDLTSNHMNKDACYHLGRLLGESLALQELVMSDCGLQLESMRRLTAFLSKRKINLLDLSKNHMGDAGFQCLCTQLKQGTVIKRLNLSYNNLTTSSALAFADAIEYNNTVTHLDLSWNKLSSSTGLSFNMEGINELIRQLSNSTVLVELNLSWNALSIGNMLRRLFNVPTIQIIDLSNNRLSSPAAKAIVLKLQAAKQLDTLDLSFNPLSPLDAFNILNTLRFKEELGEILDIEDKRHLKVAHGLVVRNYTLSRPDIRIIILKRLDFLTSRATRKCHLDIALYFLQKYKDRELMQPREILRDMKIASAPVDEELTEGLADIFPGPRADKGGKTIKLAGIIEMIERLWPERHLPPTPPEQETVPVKARKGKLNKKQQNKKA